MSFLRAVDDEVCGRCRMGSKWRWMIARSHNIGNESRIWEVPAHESVGITSASVWKDHVHVHIHPTFQLWLLSVPDSVANKSFQLLLVDLLPKTILRNSDV